LAGSIQNAVIVPPPSSVPPPFTAYRKPSGETWRSPNPAATTNPGTRAVSSPLAERAYSKIRLESVLTYRKCPDGSTAAEIGKSLTEIASISSKVPEELRL
jgi:hypothetical protein